MANQRSKTTKRIILLLLAPAVCVASWLYWSSDDANDADSVRAKVFDTLGGFESTIATRSMPLAGDEEFSTTLLTLDSRGRFLLREEYHDERIPDSLTGYDGRETWQANSAGMSRITDQEYLTMSIWLSTGFWSHPDCPVELEIDDEHVIQGEVALYLRSLELETDESESLEAGNETDQLDEPERVKAANDDRREPGLRVVVDRRTWRPMSYEIGPYSCNIREYQHAGKQLIPKVVFYSSEVDTATRQYDVVKHSGPVDFSRPPGSVDIELSFADEQYVPCQTAQTKMFVRPKVNGKDIGWFFIDSGAYRTFLTPEGHKLLGGSLPQLGVVYGAGVGTERTVSSVRLVDSIELGTMRLKNWVVNISDLSRIHGPRGEGSSKVVGLIGADFMSQCVLTYELRNSRIQLHDRYLYKLPYGKWEKLLGTGISPVMPATVDGITGRFCVDTGAPGLFLTQRATNEMQLAQETDRYRRVHGFGGSATAFESKLSRVEFGGHTFEDVPATLADDERGGLERSEKDGLIGAYFLNQFRVVFDLGGRRIAFLSL